MFGTKLDPLEQTMGGKKVGTPCEESLMILDDHAGPVIAGGGVIDSRVLGVVEARVYTGLVGEALRQNPNMPWT